MLSLKNIFRRFAILALAAFVLQAAVPAEIITVDVSPTVAASSTTGAAASIGAHMGRLVMVRVIAPDMTSSTFTLKIRDENDKALWSVASIAENTTSFIMPSQGASATPAPDWGVADFVPIASGTRTGTGLSSTSSTSWDVTATAATTESALATLVVRLYIDQDEH